MNRKMFNVCANIAPVITLKEANDFVNPELCNKCGGKCCAKYPGTTIPEDFGAPNQSKMIENLVDAFRSESWAIDWLEEGWDSAYRIYFIRPAIIGYEGKIFHAGWSRIGSCTFLTKNGCSIFEKRPSGCRGLKPGKDICEVVHSGREESAKKWFNYEHIIFSAANIVTPGLGPEYRY